MVNNYYTLLSLVGEWHQALVGTTVRDLFSQQPNELTVALEAADRNWMIRGSVQRPFLHLFRVKGYSKARRNVATLFEGALGQTVTQVRIADRDRLVFFDLSDDTALLWQLFGARANVFHVTADGTIVEAFQSNRDHAGTDAPTPYPAPMPHTFDDFEDRWPSHRNKTRQAVQSAIPLFNHTLARETLHRAGVAPGSPEDCTAAERRALFETAMGLCDTLADPTPVVYRTGHFPDAFSLLPLRHRGESPSETFDTVDAAVRRFVQRRLAEHHFHQLYNPLEEALTEAVDHYRQSAERVRDELTRDSGADRYERWGHLLMALAARVPKGAEEVELPNLFEDGAPVTIPLDPSRSPIENAQHYYRRARRTRRSREEAQRRLQETTKHAERAERLLNTLQQVDTLDGIKQFRREKEELLAPFVEQKDDAVDSFPYRRFDLGEGFEVWVGKNARQNHELTFHAAQKYDLWMHARQVPGAHTVLHLPNRDVTPSRHHIHTAAAAAAHYSKAQGSALVPVMIAERKHVTSPKGADPGVVRVDREEVVMVEPGLPGRR